MTVSKQHMFLSQVEGCPGEHFAGRADLRSTYDEFLARSKSPLACLAWLVSGTRAIGKSSLCDWCKWRAENRSKGINVVVQIPSVPDHVPRRVLQRVISGKLCRHGQRRTLATLSYIEKWCIEHVTEVPFIGGAFHAKDITTSDLARWLLEECKRIESDCAALVLIWDNLTEAGDCADLTIFCELVKEIYRKHGYLNEHDRSRSQIAIVGAARGDWKAQLEAHNKIEIPARGTTEIHLDPFTLMEVNEVVDTELSLCQNQWHIEEGFAESLYELTGGFPQLVQRLGGIANRNADVLHNRDTILIKDLQEVWTDPEFTELATKVTITECGQPFPRVPTRMACASVLRSFGSEQISDDQAKHGVLKTEWKTACKATGFCAQDFDEAFEEVFSFLLHCHVLRKSPSDDTSYQFWPVHLRPLLPVIADELEK